MTEPTNPDDVSEQLRQDASDLAAETASFYEDGLMARVCTNLGIAPTISDVMELVYQYAGARLIRNASAPTRASKGNPYLEYAHARDAAECDRLERAIRDALRAAGVRE